VVVLLLLLFAGNAAAQWKQLPIPSIHGRLASGSDGTLFVLTNGTLCYSDPSKTSWTYQPFPYDLNNQNYGYTYHDPPSQLVRATDDTLVFVSLHGDVFYIVRGQETLHSSMEGLRSKLRLNPMPYILRSRGSKGELLLCHDDFYESENNGASWTLRHKHPTEGWSFAPGAVDEQNREVLFLYQGVDSPYIHKSTDDGATWRIIPTHAGRGEAMDMLVCPEGQIYAGRLFSSDYGETWQKFTMDPEWVYDAENNLKYIYHQQTNGIFAINRSSGLFFRELDDPTFRKTVLSSTSMTERTRPGVDLSYEMLSGDIFAVINDSLYGYRDGSTTPLTYSVFAAEVNALVSNNSDGDTLLVLTPWTALQGTESGRTWIRAALYGSGSHDRTVVTFSKVTKKLIYMYSVPFPRHTWIIETDKNSSKFIWDVSTCRLTYDPFSKDTFYGGANYIWKMTDSVVLHAEDDAVLHAEILDGAPLIQQLGCISFDERRQGVMLLGGLDRNDTPFLYRTDDLGQEWKRIESIPLRAAPFEIIFDPGMENRILIFDPTGVYISTDDGATWEYRDPGLGVRKATCVALDPDNPSTVFLGVASPSRTEAIPQSRDDGGGVWMSEDGGNTWNKLPIDGLYNYNVSHLLALRNPRRVLVGTPCGAYEYILDPTNPVNPYEKKACIELQTYPNPGRGSVTISYTLDVPSPARITVYDVLGRHVFNRFEDDASQGQHVFMWDASGLRDGVYFVALETRTGTLTRRMTILR
jgi:photosystem II stability/assembly factor-like uncharacterized protein